MQLRRGQEAKNFRLFDNTGEPLSLDQFKGKKILLSFYRDASCPFCNLRIYELTRHHEEFARNGLAMIAVFHSDLKSVNRHVGRRKRPFPMLADPQKRIYELYGVESSWGDLLAAFFDVPRIVSAFTKGFFPGLGAFDPLKPADFLIGPDFSIRDIFYAKDASSHIPIERIRQFAHPTSGSVDTNQGQTILRTAS